MFIAVPKGLSKQMTSQKPFVRLFLQLVLLLFAVRVIGSAAASAADAGKLQFNRDVRPILAENCFACHGFDAKHRKASLRLDTAEGTQRKAEDGGPVIIAGNPADSEVWKRISSSDADERMPPADSHKSLTATQKETIRRWIELGAHYQKHWSFEPPLRVQPEGNAGSNVAGSGIDGFIRARLKKEGLAPSPEADRVTLLRRLAFDLTGLPPSIAEIDAFLTDRSADAYKKQVERLLASHRYGEHMAASWLDVARYSDTNGYLHDIRRTGWPWRDWVIRAFNDDMPFDLFVVEQLAGDLLPTAKPEQVLATAFCRNHPITAEGGTLAAEYLNEYAADRVQTVGMAFLDLSINCCRCHDHKFDPLTQEDFYSLLAYFNSTTEKHVENNNSPAYAPSIEIASPLLPGGDKARVMVMQEAVKPTPTYVLTRGQYDQPDKSHPVTRRSPLILGPMPADGPKNRLGLARWLVSPQNTLLARVTVNRIWQRIFGTGLVKTVDDFGVQGEYPSHPELLDYLALEFRDGDEKSGAWSTKHVVRMIVMSATYRQSSASRTDLAAKDSENRLLGRFGRQRLSAEEVRDQALFAAGLLSPKLGGPPVFPYQPAGLWEERSNEASNTKHYHRDQGDSLYRRSLYTFWKRTCPPPLMTVFDAPDRLNCCARRSSTNTPLQALATLNDEQSLECAKLLAAHALEDEKGTRERMTLLYRRATGHAPADADLQILEKGLRGLLARYRAAPADAEALLRQGATAAPENLDKPELAAWMLVASAVLNLDATLVRD
jgi:hypothetical protein